MQPVTAFSHTDVMRPVLLFLRSVAYFPTHHTCPFFTRVSAVRFGLPLITIIADREYWLTPTRSPRFLPPSPFLALSLIVAALHCIASLTAHLPFIIDLVSQGSRRPSLRSPHVRVSGSAPTGKASFPFVSLSRASFLVLNSRFASIRSYCIDSLR